MNPQRQALGIIHDEHRTLGAVIDAFRHIIDDIAAGNLSPDYKLLWSIVYYIEEFPNRLHHPKEDEVLFPLVRARAADIAATLDDLTRQHDNGGPFLDRIKTQLGRLQAGIPGIAPQLAENVATYASFHQRHMVQEESVVLARARQALTDDDWQAIATAFAANRDPLVEGNSQGAEWFSQFYSKLVALVPQPWGLGERR